MSVQGYHDERGALCRQGASVFFTGCAGTGKSLLLKHILRALPTDSTFVTASTGLAASALGGTTINAFAGAVSQFPFVLSLSWVWVPVCDTSSCSSSYHQRICWCLPLVALV